MTDESADASLEHSDKKPTCIWLAQVYVGLFLVVTTALGVSFVHSLVVRGASAAPIAEGIRIPFMLAYLVATIYALQGRHRWSYAFSVISLTLIASVWLWAQVRGPVTPAPVYVDNVTADVSPEARSGASIGLALIAPLLVLPAYIGFASSSRRYFRARRSTKVKPVPTAQNSRTGSAG
jgi:hypothetical protein